MNKEKNQQSKRTKKKYTYLHRMKSWYWNTLYTKVQ